MSRFARNAIEPVSRHRPRTRQENSESQHHGFVYDDPSLRFVPSVHCITKTRHSERVLIQKNTAQIIFNKKFRNWYQGV